MRLTLRRKLLIFSIGIAMIPLGIAGRTLIRITEDELKSSANDELSSTVRELAESIDYRYQNAWLAPLLIIRNGIDNEALGVEEKISLLTAGLGDLSSVVALQLSAEGIETPILTTKDQFSAQLESAGLDPIQKLQIKMGDISEFHDAGVITLSDLTHLPETDDWLITLKLPLNHPLAGRKAVLAARLSLQGLRAFIEEHPFAAKGELYLVDAEGRQIFNREERSLLGNPVVRKAIDMLKTDSRAISVESFVGDSERRFLAASASPAMLDWVVIVQMDEADAYLAVDKMFQSLLLWIIVGLTVAVIGAVFFALRISRPVLEIGQVAEKVSAGDLSIRVQNVRANDEIGELAVRINDMIQKLYERFHMKKFVSQQTLDAIRLSKEGVKLGGVRRTVAVLFSDIRGFTAFSEKVEPEVVIEMLNTYLRRQAYLVNQHHGDIDKYVGDQVVAVFQGDHMIQDVLRCAIEIQKEMVNIRRENPHWGDLSVGVGVHTGEVVMGAMGSEERMDYTILGDAVNLGARLCSHAAPDQILVSEAIREQMKEIHRGLLSPLDPIRVKGKERPVQIYEVRWEA